MAHAVIIGAGAAGLMAGALLVSGGHRVTILEKNEKAGKKLYITGKGRCNFTNNCSRDTFFENLVSNPRFLFSAYSVLDPAGVIELFRQWGLASKTERGSRVFPASDKSSDVIRALTSFLEKKGGRILYHHRVTRVLPGGGSAPGVMAEYNGKAELWQGDALIIAAGGLSYPATGSTGDGLRFARDLGLAVTGCRPSLVPLVCREEFCRELQGLSLKNVTLRVGEGRKPLYCGFGEMMFTHFGITGPLVLSASAYAGERLEKGPVRAWIDLKPAVAAEEFEGRIQRLAETEGKKEIRNAVKGMYPLRLSSVILREAGIDPYRKLQELSAAERKRLAEVTKALPLTILASRGYSEAVVTQGGVSVREVNPKTMESKKIPGLYWIGEVLDLDALTGGFNLQIAWSTAAACAAAVGRKEEEAGSLS